MDQLCVTLRDVKTLAVVVAIVTAVAAALYCERWFIVTTPSGNREFYQGFASYFPLTAIFAFVAFTVYRLIVRILSR